MAWLAHITRMIFHIWLKGIATDVRSAKWTMSSLKISESPEANVNGKAVSRFGDKC